MSDHFISSLCFLLIQSDSFSWLVQTASGQRRCGRAQQSDLDSSSDASSLMTDALLGQSQPSLLRTISNSSSSAACESLRSGAPAAFSCVHREPLLRPRFLASQSVFAKCPCRWWDDARREELLYVLYSQTVQGNADWRRRGRGRRETRGNSLQRGWSSGARELQEVNTLIHTLSSYILHIYTHRGEIVF